MSFSVGIGNLHTAWDFPLFYTHHPPNLGIYINKGVYKEDEDVYNSEKKIEFHGGVSPGMGIDLFH